MVPLGYRPILWHVMRYFSHFGHTQFIFCLGYKADVINGYFLKYSEAASNDFILSEGGQKLQLLASDTDDWRITFADTGLEANIGMRLRAVRKYVGGRTTSWPTTAIPSPMHRSISSSRNSGAQERRPPSSLSSPPTPSTWCARSGGRSLGRSRMSPRLISGSTAGTSLFRKDIFDYLQPGEELVMEPFQRLIKEEQLLAFQYSGF